MGKLLEGAFMERMKASLKNARERLLWTGVKVLLMLEEILYRKGESFIK